MGAPWAGVPPPAGSPVPSGMMVMSQGTSSAGEIGLPRFGPSAKAAPAPNASTSETAPSGSLRVDMLDLPLGVDRPAGDGVEVLAPEAGARRGPRGLAPPCHQLPPPRLRVSP